MKKKDIPLIKKSDLIKIIVKNWNKKKIYSRTI
jgi:hypothetical protein